MRWGLLSARVLIALVSLVIAILIITTVLPLASGDLKVDVPGNGAEPTFNDGVITYALPVDIYNGGYYDITDFKVSMKVTDGDLLIFDQTSPSANIKAGKTNHLNLALQMDLNDLPKAALNELVFNQTVLSLDIRAEGAYTFGLVHAAVHSTQSMNWDPLISEVAVDTDAATASVQGSDVVISVPYSFHASNYIAGKTIQIDAMVRNATAVVGTVHQTITVQEFNSGTMQLVVAGPAAAWLMGHPEELTVGVDIGFEGASSHSEYNYHWEGAA